MSSRCLDDRIVDSVLIRENTGQPKPVFAHILSSVIINTKGVDLSKKINVKYKIMLGAPVLDSYTQHGGYKTGALVRNGLI